MTAHADQTVAVVLGASTFREYPSFDRGEGGPAFAASARTFLESLGS